MERKVDYRRWCDVLLLGLLSFALISVLGKVGYVNNKLNDWGNFVSPLHFFHKFIICLLGLFLIFLILRAFNVKHVEHLKNVQLSFYYPPLTISIIISCLLLCAVNDFWPRLTGNFLENYFIIAVVSFAFLLFLLVVWDSSFRRNPDNATDESTLISIPDWVRDNVDSEKLFRWVFSDEALKDPTYDQFDRQTYIKRVVNLLVGGVGQYISIVGPYGIGKSSLWRCAKAEIKSKSEDYIFVPIDGWGRYEKTAAAQIIDEMIYVLSQYVDCAAIKNVPQAYMEAISGSDFYGSSSIVNILSFHNRKSPIELLRKIDNILFSIGKSMVVVLEDFDRGPDAERSINETAALLDRLKSLRMIQFILCFGPGGHSHILSRISSHREDLIGFNPNSSVKAAINLMERYADLKGIFIFKSEEDETELFTKTLKNIVKTPREMKYLLRRSLNAWEALAGEVSIYDLLAVNVIRYSIPVALDCLIEHHEEFRKEPDPQKPSSLQGELTRVAKDAGVSEEILHSAIQLIYPHWNNQEWNIGFYPQRIRGDLGRQYLTTIIEEKVKVNGRSDSEFYSGLKNCGGSGNAENFIQEVVASESLTRKFLEISEMASAEHRSVKQIVGMSPVHFSFSNYCADEWLCPNLVLEFFNERLNQGKSVFCKEVGRNEDLIHLLLSKCFEKVPDLKQKFYKNVIKRSVRSVLTLLTHYSGDEHLFFDLLESEFLSPSTSPREFVAAVEDRDFSLFKDIYRNALVHWDKSEKVVNLFVGPLKTCMSTRLWIENFWHVLDSPSLWSSGQAVLEWKPYRDEITSFLESRHLELADQDVNMSNITAKLIQRLGVD